MLLTLLKEANLAFGKQDILDGIMLSEISQAQSPHCLIDVEYYV
jgi:hypothetical protein